MVWEIYSYGSGEYLRQVFNAIAMIFGNGDYFDAWRIVTLVTFIGIMIKVAFSREGAAHFRYVLTVIFIVYTLFIPKTDVVITDTIVPSNTATVANVPIGIAMTAGAFSKFGYWMTETTETVFGMPTQNKPTKTGFLFYSELFEQLNKATIADKRTAENYRKFFASCVIVDGIGHKRFTWEDVVNSPDLDNFFKTKTADKLAGFFYTSSTGSDAFNYCRQGYTKISADLIGTMPQALKKVSVPWAKDYNGVTNASNFLKNNLGITVASFTGQTNNVNNIMKQYMGANELHSALAAFAADVNDSTTSDYIIARANTERSTTFKAVGRVAAERLPLVRAVMEGIIYALFPFVGLMMLASPLAVGSTYLKALIWINLWAPIFALIHFAKVSFDTDRISGIVEVYGGLTANGINNLNAYMADASSIAGYLMGGLPVITWILLSRSGAMMASMTGRVTDGFEKAIEKGAEETTAGRGSAVGKDWRMSQADALKDNMAFAGQQTPSVGGLKVSSLSGTGSEITTSANGNLSIANQKSDTIVAESAKNSFVRSAESAYNQATSAVSTTTGALTESTNTAISQLKSSISQIQNTKGYQTQDGNSVQNAINNSSSRVTQDVMEKMQAKGFSKDDASKIAGGVNWSMGLKAEATTGTQSISREQMQEGQKYLQSNEGRQMLSNVSTDISSAIRSSGYSNSNALSDNLNASSTRMTQASFEQKSAIAEKEEATNRLALAERISNDRTFDDSTVLVSAYGRLEENQGLSAQQVGQKMDSILIGTSQRDEADTEQYEQIVSKVLGERYGNAEVQANYDQASTHVLENGTKQVQSTITEAKQKAADASVSNRAAVSRNSGVDAGQVSRMVNSNPKAGLAGATAGAGTPVADRTGFTGADIDKKSTVVESVKSVGENANDAVNSVAETTGKVVGSAYNAGKEFINSSNEDKMKTATAVIMTPVVRTAVQMKELTDSFTNGFMDGNPKKGD